MGPIEMLVMLDEQVLSIDKLPDAASNLEMYGSALAEAATVPEGYSGLVWKCGTKLLQLVEEKEGNPEHFFEAFGWPALANGIRVGLSNRHILEVLSFSKEGFLPPRPSQKVFDHALVRAAVQNALQVTSRPFVDPAELASAPRVVQAQFVDLLSLLVSQSTDIELRLQWSACALRVLSMEPALQQAAAISLLQTLLHGERYFIAYYSFRALAEQFDSLWNSPVALQVLRLFIEHCLENIELAGGELTALLTDDDVLRKCDVNFNLLTLIGITSIYLIHNYNQEDVDTTAWRFVNDLQNDFGLALLAYHFSNYIMHENESFDDIASEKVARLEMELYEAINDVENELAYRSYRKQLLAIKIYQYNVDNIFIPLLLCIKKRDVSDEVIKKIELLDADKLITESEPQKKDKSSTPIMGNLYRQMVTDNRKIIFALRFALLKYNEWNLGRQELERTTSRSKARDELNIFIDSLSEEGKWATKALLPDLLRRLA